MAKLKLDAIKSWQKPETKIPETNNEHVLPDISVEKNLKNIPLTIEQEEIKKTNKISLARIKSSQQNKAPTQNTAEEKILPQQEQFQTGAHCKMRNIELFPAYTSKFKRQQGTMLQKIQQLKRIPRTNKTFVLLAIWITLLWISVLFILAPEKHNIQNYKTSIFEAYHAMNWVNELQSKDPQNPTQTQVEIGPEIISAEPPSIQIPEPPIQEESIDTDLGLSSSWSIDENNATQTWSIQRDLQYYQNIKSQILNTSSQ